MKIICISDTHTQRVKNLPEGDLLIHAGDYSGRGSLPHLVGFVAYMESLKTQYKNIICISGNHDFNGEKEPVLTKQLFSQAGLIYLDDSGIELDGLNIWGSPVSPEFGGWAFNRNQIEIQDHWDLIPNNTDILITHCPPFGIMDKLSEYGSEPGARVGCPFLRKTIDVRLKNLKLHIFGHIHEGYGIHIQDNPKITFINASSLNEHYKQKNDPIMVEL